MYTFTIPLEAKTKKNSQRIIHAGGRPRIIQSQQYLEYEQHCSLYLKPLDIDYPINLKCLFYMPTLRRVDLSNLLASISDILVHHDVIRDDNFRIIKSYDGSRVKYDKLNPRTEIEITKYDNDE